MLNYINLFLNTFDSGWIKLKDTQEALYIIKQTMLWLTGVVAAFGVIYVIVLGVNYAKAEGDGRAQAKKRMVNAIIGFVFFLVALVLLVIFIDNMEDIYVWVRKYVDKIFP